MLSDLLRYARARARSKGMLDIASGMSRRYLGGFAVQEISRMAWLRYRVSSARPRYEVVQIQTQTGCNYRCPFCPNGKLDIPPGRMSDELYDDIIGQLSKFEGAIHLHLMNEPLLDDRIVDLARRAKTRTRARVLLQTNGSVLTSDVASGLTRFATVIVNDYTEQALVHRRVRGFADAHSLILMKRTNEGTLSNRAGNLAGRNGGLARGFCIRPFRQMCILSDGRVVLCCQDWGREAVMGSLAEQTLQEIWNGTAFEAVRRQLLGFEREHLCVRCDFPGV